MEELSTLSVYSREDVGKILFADYMERKNRQWELVDCKEILRINVAALLNSYHQPLFNSNEMFVVNQKVPLKLTQDPLIILRRVFFFLDALMDAFPGKIVAAGGAIFKSLIPQETFYDENDYGYLKGSDIDLFFINCTQDEADEIIRYAWNMVHKSNKVHSCCTRCQTTTTIAYSSDEDEINDIALYGEKMQFIHRIYPTKESVIGAFDLGPCMALYDGHDIYATRFGAWSIATQTIVLDVSRRSTSFEHRIGKYVDTYKCTLVIVNGSSKQVYQTLKDDSLLAHRAYRPFFPVKGMKLLSLHRATKEWKDPDGDIDNHLYHGDINNDNNVVVVQPPTISLQTTWASKSGSNPFLNVAFLDGGEKIPVMSPVLLEISDNRFGLDPVQNFYFPSRDPHNLEHDYGGGEFNEYTFEQSNAVFAAKDLLNYICWRSNKTEEIFDRPKVVCRVSFGLAESITLERRRTKGYLPRFLVRWFGYETYQRITQGRTIHDGCIMVNRVEFHDACLELNARIQRNIETSQVRAENTITFITDNPGRQWTASFNPVVSNVRDYYHPDLLVNGPLVIGIPHDIFFFLRMCQMKKVSIWGTLTKDSFMVVMKTLAGLIAEEGFSLCTIHDELR